MRPIDADALLDTIPKNTVHPCHEVIMSICDAPTIDPVKHAKWIPHRPGDVHACSSCGFGVLPSRWFKNGIGIGPVISHNKFRYCPNCGAMMVNAKMDGVPHDDSGQ